MCTFKPSWSIDIIITIVYAADAWDAENRTRPYALRVIPTYIQNK